MSETKLKLAICQIRTERDRAETMEKAARMVRDAAENGAEIVVLPEMYNTPYSPDGFREAAALGHEDSVRQMSAWARENRILLVGGSIPEIEDGRMYNSCFIFDAEGRQIARHRKVHLFEIDVPGMRFSEKKNFTEGRDVTTFETPWGTMGAAVCFDVRFPELFRAMARRGARVIFVPAQFNLRTGPNHWEMSMRARAVDNELFIVAASAARYEGFHYECWGHSLVVDPFGVVLCQADEKEQILYAEIDLARVDEVRAQLPTFLHLREDVYTVAE